MIGMPQRGSRKVNPPRKILRELCIVLHDNPITLHDRPNSRVTFSLSVHDHTGNPMLLYEIRVFEGAEKPRKSLFYWVFSYPGT